ncbi:MAG TPA: protein kinase, partial [Vicinamibacterales bacterium]|nr:protein kinase [Vicinamibacterales bacterium]
EARAISALDHPHICALHDIGEHEGTSYLVMQFLEGETLAERLTRGTLPVPDALRVATQIAGALDAAHRTGIVHRDLKPGNIMLTKAGARLLDFGLAKTAGAAARTGDPTALTTSPTMTSPAPLTAQGTILGTFQYMAPEQIEGEEADARTDIFAFGAVLYEMLTGRRAFTGKTQASLIGSIMRDVPAPAGSLSADVPGALDRIVARCLAKDPDERWQTARDLMKELEWIAGGGAASDAPAGSAVAAPASASRGRFTRIAVPAAAALVAAVATWLATRPAEVPAPRVEFSVPVPRDAPVRRGSGGELVFSPDGRLIVYVADPVGSQRSVLYRRRLDTAGAEPIAGTEGGFAPFFSPDSREIGFFTDQSVMRVPVAGGRPTPITAKGRFSRAAWLPDSTIVLGTSLSFSPGALGRVPAAGGDVTEFTTLAPGEQVHQMPRALPDGRHVLFSVHNQAGGQLAVAALDSGAHRTLGVAGSDARYLAPGTILYARAPAMFAVPFDLDRLEVTGPEVGILETVEANDFGFGISLALADVDAAGNAVYLPSLATRNKRLAWKDSSGTESPIDLEPMRYAPARISLDGHRFVAPFNARANSRLRVVDVDRSLPLDLEPPARAPIWATDGWLTFSGPTPDDALGTAIFRMPADDSAPPEILFESPLFVTVTDWSPDGRTLVLETTDSRSNRGSVNRDLQVWTAGGTLTPLLDSEQDEAAGRISPDGRWLAYQAATPSGRPRVYVRPFNAPGGTRTVSGEGGIHPVWARDGRALFFLENGTLMRATVTNAPFDIRPATPLFDLPPSTDTFDVAPDGRFLVVLDAADRSGEELHVILGWTPGTTER